MQIYNQKWPVCRGLKYCLKKKVIDAVGVILIFTHEFFSWMPKVQAGPERNAPPHKFSYQQVTIIHEVLGEWIHHEARYLSLWKVLVFSDQLKKVFESIAVRKENLVEEYAAPLFKSTQYREMKKTWSRINIGVLFTYCLTVYRRDTKCWKWSCHSRYSLLVRRFRCQVWLVIVGDLCGFTKF